jgi:protein Mpv17
LIALQAALLFGISDQMAQGLEFRRNRKSKDEPLPPTNKKRSLYSGLVGFLYFGPMSHLWYGWIFRTFPGKSVVSILQKAALGQFFFAPPLFCVFFAAALLQNGQFTISNWVQKIKKDLVKGWLGGIGFWPIVNYISYGYVPQKYIPLFVNLMGLVFNIYVSIIANLKQKE